MIPGQRATSPKGERRYVGLPWPIVAPIVAQTALQPEVAATSLPCLVTQCLAAGCRLCTMRPATAQPVTPPSHIHADLTLRSPSLTLSRKSSRSLSTLLIQSVIRLSTTVNCAFNFISRINISSICDELETNSSRMSRDWPSDNDGSLGRINMEQGYVYCL